MNDTGESIRSFNKRSDEAAWPGIKEFLQGGATLKKPRLVDTYFPFKDGLFFGHCLTKTGVLNLEKKGVLILAGVQTYALNHMPSSQE